MYLRRSKLKLEGTLDIFFSKIFKLFYLKRFTIAIQTTKLGKIDMVITVKLILMMVGVLPMGEEVPLGMKTIQQIKVLVIMLMVDGSP